MLLYRSNSPTREREDPKEYWPAGNDALLATFAESVAAETTATQLEFPFAHGASVQTPGVTTAGETFDRVGAGPQNLKFGSTSLREYNRALMHSRKRRLMPLDKIWTDMNLFHNRPLAEVDIRNTLNDYKKIRIEPQYRRLRSIVGHQWKRCSKEHAGCTYSTSGIQI